VGKDPAAYKMRRGSHDERSVRSLHSHWDTIKAEVGKFCAYYADIVRENSSRASDANKVLSGFSTAGSTFVFDCVFDPDG
jgi:hypothetical protein